MLRAVAARFGRLGLQWRILLYVTIGLVVFSLVYGFLSLQAIQQSSDVVVRERLLVARSKAHEVDEVFIHIQDDLDNTGAIVAEALAANDPAGVQNALHALHKHWVDFNALHPPGIIALTDPSGRVLESEPIDNGLLGRDLADLPYLHNAFQSKRPIIGGGLALNGSGRPTVVVAAPILADAQLNGFLVSEIDRAQIGNALQSALSVEQAGYAVELIDSTGLVIASNEQGNQFSLSPHLQLIASDLSAAQAEAHMHSYQVNGEERSHIIAFAPLAQIPWGVVVEQEADEALILPHTLQTQVVVFGLLALLGGLALAWVTTRAVVWPVNALIHASKGIAQGDLEHPLDVSGEGEVGTLARSFDEMRTRLRESRAEIARWNRELEARVEQRTRELSQALSREEQHTRELAALVESSHALTSTLELDTLFEILMQQSRSVLPAAEGIALFLFEPEGEVLRVRSTAGFDAQECLRLRFRTDEAISGRVFTIRAPALLTTTAEVEAAQANLADENRTHFERAVGGRTVHSAMGVPLISKGARLGALIMYNFSREAAFAESEIPVLQALADQAATAIENAQLYTALQEKEVARTQLLEKVIQAQEEERQRVAREIHDELGQLLTRLSINLQMCERRIPTTLPDLRHHFEATQTLVWQTMEQAHRLIVELRPTLLDELGLEAALREELNQRLAPSGVATTLTSAGGALERLPVPVEIAIFRIAQEAISNIARHAHARQATIALCRDGTYLQVVIEDDGVGLPEGFYQRSNGHYPLGLLGMQERVALLGGTLALQPGRPHGTRVIVRVPVHPDASPGGTEHGAGGSP